MAGRIWASLREAFGQKHRWVNGLKHRSDFRSQSGHTDRSDLNSPFRHRDRSDFNKDRSDFKSPRFGAVASIWVNRHHVQVYDPPSNGIFQPLSSHRLAISGSLSSLELFYQQRRYNSSAHQPRIKVFWDIENIMCKPYYLPKVLAELKRTLANIGFTGEIDIEMFAIGSYYAGDSNIEDTLKPFNIEYHPVQKKLDKDGKPVKNVVDEALTRRIVAWLEEVKDEYVPGAPVVRGKGPIHHVAVVVGSDRYYVDIVDELRDKHDRIYAVVIKDEELPRLFGNSTIQWGTIHKKEVPVKAGGKKKGAGGKKKGAGGKKEGAGGKKEA